MVTIRYRRVQETFVMHKKGDVIIMRAEQNFKWEKLSLGTCYYPEHWDKSLWRDDLRRKKMAFLQFVLRSLHGIRLSRPKGNLRTNFLMSFWMWQKKNR